jgi:hypothetical protein
MKEWKQINENMAPPRAAKWFVTPVVLKGRV